MSWFNTPAAAPEPPRREYAAVPPPPQRTGLPTAPSSRVRPPAPQYAQDQPRYPSEDTRRGGRVAPPPSSSPNANRGGALGRPGRYSVVEAPSTAYALTNCLVVNEQDWGGVPYVIIKGQYVLTVKYVSLCDLALRESPG